MLRFAFMCVIYFLFFSLSNAQSIPNSFGKGFNFYGKDSTFYMKVGFRFQNLHTSEWTLIDDQFDQMDNYEGAFLVRRSRLKLDGWILSPKLVYKFEAGLSNRDHSSNAQPEFRRTSNLILDASLEYKFYRNFSILFGQRKLPGNRERVISSGNLQFVDRSRLNSRFNLDRDMGFQLLHYFNLGNVVFNEIVAVSQGEGRNVTEGFYGGYQYTFRGEILPFGNFESSGDYVGGALKFENSPKLSIGFTYDLNNNAVRERGNLGSFIKNEEGDYFGKDLISYYIDAMFKYQNLSFMAEYAHRRTDDNNPNIMNSEGLNIGTFYTGSGINLQSGYMLPKYNEISVRFTKIKPDEGVSNLEYQYTLGYSKYIVGHKLKIQSDLSLIAIENRNNRLLFRTQLEVHF